MVQMIGGAHIIRSFVWNTGEAWSRLGGRQGAGICGEYHKQGDCRMLGYGVIGSDCWPNQSLGEGIGGELTWYCILKFVTYLQ